MDPLDPPVQSCTLPRIGPSTCAVCDTELPASAASDSPLFPFCSRRCKLIDLYRWTEGKYAIVEPLTLEQLLEEQVRDGRDSATDES